LNYKNKGMEYKNRGAVIYFPIIVALAVVTGILIGRYYSGSNTENKFIIIPKANKLDNVLNYIENEYVDEVSKTDIIEQVIPKILEDLDPHSQYIPAVELQKVNEPLEGNFSGIGIQFNMLSDTLVVIQTVANGPSQKVGIQAGDRIIKVNGEVVAGMNLPSDSIVGRLRGPKGTRVKVEISRKCERPAQLRHCQGQYSSLQCGCCLYDQFRYWVPEIEQIFCYY